MASRSHTMAETDCKVYKLNHKYCAPTTTTAKWSLCSPAEAAFGWRNGNLLVPRTLGGTSGSHGAADLDFSKPSSELHELIQQRSSDRVRSLQWISMVETPHGAVCQQKPITLRGSHNLICLDVPSSTSQPKTEDTEGNAFRTPCQP